ncbi:MAG: hypothetical protein BroJett026_17260 [Betaproteobacteria bacterium]|nr:MAG: hypothetical protein BroJett026_17260 [Betaproteobacteria bacterium]
MLHVPRTVLALAFAALTGPAAFAQVPSFAIDAAFSSADGTVQFVVLRETQGADQQHAVGGRTLRVTTRQGAVRTLTLPRDLPSAATAGRRVLVGSRGFRALGLIAADYEMPDRFLPVEGGTLDFAGADVLDYASLPTDGVLARARDGSAVPNLAANFAGRSAQVPPRAVGVVEYLHAGLDHYFVSPLAPDLDALDSGRLPGWTRTGLGFGAWPSAAGGGGHASPVCRFYIPPQKGDSHFFSASPAECAEVARRIDEDPAYAGIVLEAASAFHVALPDAASGACAPGTVPVYRLWNARADANHRYTTSRAVRDAMLAQGFVPEGYGPASVAMCAPPLDAVSVVRASAASPYPAGCSVSGGVAYVGAEVEPHLAINPRDPRNLIGVWQQDRWSNGAARGLMTGASFDGGRTWERRSVPFTRCSGGTAGNGGDFDRASDPWVTFGPDGTAWQSALSVTGTTFVAGSRSAITVSRSADGGRTWSDARALIVDDENFFNDKEAITADPADARYVYVAWDRLRRSGGGPAYFARTTDGGATWEPARELHDPGPASQAIGTIPVVTSDGTLLVFFMRLDAVDGRNVPTLQVMRSPDKGATFGPPVTIAAAQPVGARDPDTGASIRDATILGSIAAGPANQLAVVWQDARFSGGVRDGIALSRSFDGGLTWSVPVRVNRDPLVAAFVPTVAIRDDGVLGVSYFDLRSNTLHVPSLETDYWLAQSADGATWRETRLAGPFDLSIAPNANGLFVGDYMALGVRGGQFVPFFATANDGDLGNRTDVHVAFVDGPGDAPVVAKGAVAHAANAADTYAASAPAAALVVDEALAARIDDAVRAAMQRRVPGWRTPAMPGAAAPPVP